MREIASPLSGPFTTFGQTPIDIYKVGAYRPELAYSFYNEYYRRGRQPVNFLDAITHTRNGNATMVDSDGVLKWAPHNLALNSATPATQSITVVSGVDYTVECTGVSIALSGAGTGTVTEGNPVEITASTTTLTLTVTGSSGTMWVYRSDLGGMVNNPDTGNTYVPTTSSAVYLPRRGHHVYNGSQWVNKGLLHESESRTNLITYSEDLTDGSWSPSNLSKAASGEWTELTTNGGGVFSRVAHAVSGGAGTYTFTYEVDTTNSTGTYCDVGINGTGIGGSYTASYYKFDFATAALTVRQNGGADATYVENLGNGVYRISVTWAATTVTSYIIHHLWNDSTSGVVLYVRRPQLEQGSTPSSYIPTSGSSVTRAAETLTIPSENLPWPSPVYVTNEELVTNGTFDTDTTGWTLSYSGTPLSVVNGALRVTEDGADGSSARAYQAITCEVGKVYRASVYMPTSSQSAGLLAIGTTGGAYGGRPQAAVTSGNTTVLDFVADATTLYVQLVNSGTSADYSDFDNISVKEINPLALSIQMSGEMTYADTGVQVTSELFSWRPSGTNKILHYVDTQSTKTGDIAVQQVYDGVYDTVFAGDTYLSSGVSVPFNYSARHGTTFVQAAYDGVSVSANTTPTTLVDLSSTDASLGSLFMGTISLFRIWADDLGDTGIEEATEPSTQATLFLSFDGTETSYVDFEWSV